MKYLLALTLSTLTFAAQAGITCTGTYQGMELYVDFSRGFLHIGGQEVATFARRDVNINMLRGTMTVRNSQGSVFARLTSLRNQTGVISSMSIPNKGISATNLPIRCQL